MNYTPDLMDLIQCSCFSICYKPVDHYDTFQIYLLQSVINSILIYFIYFILVSIVFIVYLYRPSLFNLYYIYLYLNLFIIGVVCSCCLAPQFAQEIVIPPLVVGYTGSYVILPCKLPNPGVNELTQMQWDYVVQNTSKQILIYLPPSNVSIPDSPLKGRFSLKYSSEQDFSAVIREVVMADRGQYTCSLNVFPSGIFKLNTQLVVQGKSPPSVNPYTYWNIISCSQLNVLCC